MSAMSSARTASRSTSYNWRLFGLLWGLSVIGLIAAVPYSLALVAPALAKTPPPMPLPLLIPIQIAEGAIEFGIFAAAGLFLAGRIGLGAPVFARHLRGEPVRAQVRALLAPALLLGIGGAVLVVALDALVFNPPMRAELNRLHITLAANGHPAAWQGLLASLYGGFDEEILARLFVLTLLAWLFSRLVGPRQGLPGRGVLWTATLGAALLFGLGHLHAAAVTGLPLDALVVTRTLVLNGLLALAYGWLYWTYGLESAMLAHLSADLVVHALTPLLLPAFIR